MNKPLTFLLALTFLFLFSGSSVVFAWELGECEDAYLKQDYKTAHKCWLSLQTRLLTEKGWDRAQIFFGMMHELGQGISKDYKEAVKWYRLSAEQGDADAQFNLGLMYRNGLGIQRNYKEAVKWFRLSAVKGFAKAQNNLGMMYDKGLGVPQDEVLAHMWWNIASSNGDKYALENRKRLEKKMSPSKIEKAQEMARNWKPKR